MTRSLVKMYDRIILGKSNVHNLDFKQHYISTHVNKPQYNMYSYTTTALHLKKHDEIANLTGKKIN